MRRGLLPYALALVLLGAGFASSVVALNNDLYSAHGFVRSYLGALERHDSGDALAFDGVVVPEGASLNLMTDEALGDITAIRLLSDVATGDQHVVRFETVIAGEERTTEFHVEHSGARFGLFSTWRFTVSPIATLAASADHDDRLTANGVELIAGDYPVLVPASIELHHESKYLEAQALIVPLTDVGERTEAVVEVTAKPLLDEDANVAIKAYLDDCVTQRVLKPTGCPMSESILNRVNGEPQWSIDTYPTVELEPGTTAREWRSPATGLADFSVEVKAILDGATSQLDEKVYFSCVYVVLINPDDSLTVTVDFTTLGGFTG